MRKNVFDKIFKILCFSLLFISIFSSKANATVESIPDMLVGQTTVYTGGRYSYGGMGGNYAVLNYDVSNQGLDSSTLSLLGGCQNNAVTEPLCFRFGTYSNALNFTHIAGRLLTSRTSVTDPLGNKQIVMELPALFYGKSFIVGDTANGLPLNNFSYWGKNLAQAKNGTVDPATGASWSLDNYKINDNSQSSWNEDSKSEFTKFDNKLKTLIDSGTIIAESQITSGSPLYLQTLNTTSITSNQGAQSAQSAKYPEGRVWVISGTLNIPANMTIRYSGIGTIIITGNLIVGDGTKIIPADSKNDRLGIIVLSN